MGSGQRLLFASFLAVAAAASTGSASACVTEMLGPGETEAMAQARWRSEAHAAALETQRDLWTRADRVFVATATEPEPPESKPYDPRRDGPPRRPRLARVDWDRIERPAILTPSAALKGASPPRPFEVVDSATMTSCGYRFRFNADGEGGGGLLDKGPVIVFSTGPYSGRGDILDALSLDRIVDPTIKTALARAGVPHETPR